MKFLKFWCTQFVSLFLMVGLALTIVGCQPICQKIEPVLICPIPSHRINCLPSAFPCLSPDEQQQEWAKELQIGNVFAKECDFYRAITCYKRALILLPPTEMERHLQLDYNIMLCYYLGAKYQETLNIFEASELSQANPTFPAFNNLLLIVYDSYLRTGQEDKAACVLEIIRKFSPETAEDLFLYQNLKSGEIEMARCLMSQHRHAEAMEKDFAFYDQFAKSPQKARTLNAILPGAGYYYVGQRKAALTSFIINALFTAAAYQFFHRGYPAAGAITASLEAGWYLGGINGAGIEAQEFNTRLYEGVSRKILTEHDCFPILMFETSF
jgi:tetratricopeptide (TPR) repeat protein